MDYSHALERLRNHANAAGSILPEDESFLLALWQAERQSHIPELRSLFDDILSCFVVVNQTLNTQHPSETIAGKAEALPRSLVADVSSILSEGWSYYWRWTSNEQFTAKFRTEFAAILVQIGIAWDAILAGDIDDIRQEVETEFMAKGYVI
jgi:hypothetical protein